MGTGGYRWVLVGTSGYWWIPVGTSGVPHTGGPLVESKYYIVTNLDCYKLRLLQTLIVTNLDCHKLRLLQTHRFPMHGKFLAQKRKLGGSTI